MMQARRYGLEDVRCMLLHARVPRRKRDRWAAYSAFTNHVLPCLAVEQRDEVCRLSAEHFQV